MFKNQKTIAVFILMLVFTTWFLHYTKGDFSLIFQKDLLAHDESSNSVVEANITRKFFPPMVRVNPLNEQQGNWMEGPFWQHIPPLFAYVPSVFFKLDGQVTVEVKRLSYALVTLLTGLLFIWAVSRFKKNLLAAFSATLAAIFWANTPFTHELITGYAFGASDIVLAFTVVCGFASVLWYLEGEKEERINYPLWKFAVFGLVAALPIMAKNLLGAIPAATFFVLLLKDNAGNSFTGLGSKAFYKNTAICVGSFLGLLLVYFLPLYFSSPQTFKSEILVSFLHFKQLEGWGRPWHFYLTSYLPQRYLGQWTLIYFAGLVAGGIFLYRTKLERKDKILVWFSGGWFVWNLAAITLVTSKVPNFIYQGYLFSLFFILYSAALFIDRHFERLARNRFNFQGISRFGRDGIILILILSVMVTSYEVIRFAHQFKVQRTQAYNYQTERGKFYQTAEELRRLGLNTKDLIIVRLSDSDCWFRYYPLFLTGTESKTLLEMSFGYDNAAIKQKYSRMYFVEDKDGPDFGETQRQELQNYSLLLFDLENMTADQIKIAVDTFINFHQADIAQDILRIKKDKSSCQWLVPDPILNAP